MTKFKIKVGDTVKVIAGDHKGSEGKVLQILKDKNRVLVEGVNLVSKHTKPSAQNPQGGIVKKEASIHVSNVGLLEDGKAVRVGYRVEGTRRNQEPKKEYFHLETNLANGIQKHKDQSCGIIIIQLLMKENLLGYSLYQAGLNPIYGTT